MHKSKKKKNSTGDSCLGSRFLVESYPYLQTMRHPNLSIPPSCSENVYLIWYLGLQVKSEVLIITQRKPSRKYVKTAVKLLLETGKQYC